MTWITVKRIARAGFLNFWRNAFVSFSSILIMIETLFILGMVIFTGIILNTTLTELRNKADINVYFVTSAQEERIAGIKESLEALPEIVSVEYISREEALARFRERYRDDQLILQSLEELGENPLQAVLNVKTKDISQYGSVANFLKGQEALAQGEPPVIDKINYLDPRYRDALDRLQNITDAAGRLGLIIIGIFVATTVTILFNMIRLTIYTSREEISVMRLVGAESFYIRAPFMIEGMLEGLVAGVVTLLLFYPLTWWLGASTEDFFGGINVFTYYLAHFPLFFLSMVGAGVALGALSNFFAVRRYLKI